MAIGHDILECVGFETVIDRIASGETYREIADAYGVKLSQLYSFLHATKERDEQCALALEKSAEAWIDKGIGYLEQAMRKDSEYDVQAARALAQECARRAAIRNRNYSDKPQVAVQINNNAQPLALPDNVDPVAASRAYQALIEGKTPSK